MMFHTTYPRPVDPLVTRNPYRQRQSEPREIMRFERARELLPEPVLPDRPEWVEMYWRAWEIAWQHLRRPRPGSGFVANYIDTAFNDNSFMWDSCFMMRFGLYARRAHDFMGTLDNFYAKQHPDGFICREISTLTGRDNFYPFDPNSTGPNILAWAEWQYYRYSGDDSRLSQVFYPLLAYHHWLRAHRTWPSQLYWATGLASGMDNQPRIPGKDSHHYHHHWTWIDTNMQVTLNCLLLGQMAQALDEPELAQELGLERTFLQREINTHMWHADAAFYKDIGPAGEFSPAKSIGAYWGLLDKDLIPPDRLDPFIRHLRDANVFMRPHRVPSLSADSDGYDAVNGNYWCGGVWSPTNYMLLKGLRSVGQPRLAHQIATNHLQHVAEVFQHSDTFWENYAPEQAAPGQPAKPNFIGWTGLSPIAMLLEDVIGLQVDWPLRRVTWDRRLETTAAYGVRNYPLGPDGTLEILGDAETLTIVSDVPFNLTVVDDEGSLQTSITAGTTEIKL